MKVQFDNWPEAKEMSELTSDELGKVALEVSDTLRDQRKAREAAQAKLAAETQPQG